MNRIFLTCYIIFWLGVIAIDYPQLSKLGGRYYGWYASLMFIALMLYIPAWLNYTPSLPTRWIISWVIPIVKNVLHI